MASVAESWAKAWYADMIVGIQPAPAQQLRFRVLKNRFGPRDNQITFNFNLEDLTWDSTGELDLEDW
jgi:hypothetical protein